LKTTPTTQKNPGRRKRDALTGDTDKKIARINCQRNHQPLTWSTGHNKLIRRL